MTSPLKFCGRASELDAIIARWRLASNIENPDAQIVVIKAERGVGKTRLALEFCRWLSERVDKGNYGYWPDALEIIERNLQINSEPQNCNFKLPIPYLWWGLRAGDPGVENAVAGDAIATYDKYLAPHLVALLVRAKMKNRAWEVTRAWGEVGLDLASSALQVDNILSVGKGLFRTAEIIIGAIHETAAKEAMAKPVGRATSALLDMQKIFNPAAITYAKTPGVIFLDDAQFVHEDAALPSFIERLMYTAVNQSWPVLILLTHWRAELSPELISSEDSFAAILKHAREGLPTDNGPTAGLPGGYLTNTHFAVIDLNPVPDLSIALRDKLPGLAAKQSAAILDCTGGNPRFLEQVIAFLLENENFFENTDPSGPLTAEGFEETLKDTRSQEIFKIVLRRLRSAPEDVQEAICLASIQGMRFVPDLVDGLAKVSLGHTVREPLRKAEDPYSMVIGTKALSEPIGQFAERLIHQVAQHRRRSLKSLGGESSLQSRFKNAIATIFEDSAYVKNTSIEARALIFSIVANLFERSPEPAERNLAQRALGELARVELSRFSFESAAATYERLLTIESHSHSLAERRNRLETWDVLASMYGELNWPAKSARALRKIFWEATNCIPDGFDIFLRSTDCATAQERFSEWKHDHSDWSPDLYVWVVRRMVSVLLRLSELARAWPNLKIKEGDDPLDKATFLVRVGERPAHAANKNDETLSTPENLVQAMFLMERAYAQDGVLGAWEVEKKHFRILEDLAKTAVNGGDFQAATALLLRAFRISHDKLDDLHTIAALSNLGMVAGLEGNLAASKNYLEQARSMIEGILAEDTFLVKLVIDGEDTGRHVAGSTNVNSLAVPVRFSSAFDKNPHEVVNTVLSLKQQSANIYGNLAANALKAEHLVEAKEGFLHALTIHREIGDKENVARDLQNLGKIEHIEGNLPSACSYWSECVEIFRELERRDTDKVSVGVWTTAIRDMLDGMRACGCGN